MSSSKKDKEIFERMVNATALLTKAGSAMIEDAKNNPCPDGPLAGKLKQKRNKPLSVKRRPKMSIAQLKKILDYNNQKV